MNRREYIMKHMKKLALLGLTAVMSLSLLAGCGGTTGNAETPDAGETTPGHREPGSRWGDHSCRRRVHHCGGR